MAQPSFPSLDWLQRKLGEWREGVNALHGRRRGPRVSAFGGVVSVRSVGRKNVKLEQLEGLLEQAAPNSRLRLGRGFVNFFDDLLEQPRLGRHSLVRH